MGFQPHQDAATPVCLSVCMAAFVGQKTLHPTPYPKIRGLVPHVLKQVVNLSCYVNYQLKTSHPSKLHLTIAQLTQPPDNPNLQRRFSQHLQPMFGCQFGIHRQNPIFVLLTRNTFHYTLVESTVTRLVQDPLAVTCLKNRLYILLLLRQIKNTVKCVLVFQCFFSMLTQCTNLRRFRVMHRFVPPIQ